MAAIANDDVSVSNQRLANMSPPPNREQMSSEYLRTGSSESSTSSSATEADPNDQATGAAEQAETVGAERGTSGADTDATTCDTVSATMWFDRPEVTTSFVTCDVSDDDDDDADSVNSNNYKDEEGNGTDLMP